MKDIISQILFDLLDCSSKFYNDTLLFEQHISNTFFHHDSIWFRKKTGLQVPQKTLSEIINNSKEIKNDNQWREDEFNEKEVVISGRNDTTLLARKPYIKCLSEKQ